MEKKPKKNGSAAIDYASFGEDFHESMVDSKNPVRSWFHRSKNSRVLENVKLFFPGTKKIVDLGCGTVNWNTEQLPVFGVDLNSKMLEKAKKEKRLLDGKTASVQKTGLLADSADIVVISEVLEHLPDFEGAIKEIRRILKPNGVCIATVPFDTNTSLWKPLFSVHCFIQGRLLGKEYFKNGAGHVNHFSPASIARAFEKNGFRIENQFGHYRFTIFTVARKQGGME